jgi:hypothetical protein
MEFDDLLTWPTVSIEFLQRHRDIIPARHYRGDWPGGDPFKAGRHVDTDGKLL